MTSEQKLLAILNVYASYSRPLKHVKQSNDRHKRKNPELLLEIPPPTF